MENFGDTIVATDIFNHLSNNKVITFIKLNNMGKIVKYTIARTDNYSDKIYGETYEFTCGGRDPQNKLVELTWMGKKMLENFISCLNIVEWKIYAK